MLWSSTVLDFCNALQLTVYTPLVSLGCACVSPWLHDDFGWTLPSCVWMNSELSEHSCKVEVASAFAAFIHSLLCWELTLLCKGLLWIRTKFSWKPKAKRCHLTCREAKKFCLGCRNDSCPGKVNTSKYSWLCFYIISDYSCSVSLKLHYLKCVKSELCHCFYHLSLLECHLTYYFLIPFPSLFPSLISFLACQTALQNYQTCFPIEVTAA